jgi:hypothetical protein
MMSIRRDQAGGGVPIILGWSPTHHTTTPHSLGAVRCEPDSCLCLPGTDAPWTLPRRVFLPRPWVGWSVDGKVTGVGQGFRSQDRNSQSLARPFSRLQVVGLSQKIEIGLLQTNGPSTPPPLHNHHLSSGCGRQDAPPARAVAGLTACDEAIEDIQHTRTNPNSSPYPGPAVPVLLVM